MSGVTNMTRGTKYDRGSKPDFSNIKLRNGAYMSRITNMAYKNTQDWGTRITGGTNWTLETSMNRVKT